MKTKNWQGAVGAVIVLSIAPFAVANVLVNGNFEGGTYVDSGTGDILPIGWVVGPPSPASLSKVNIDTAVNPAIDLGPQDGTHYARFQSPATNGTRDCLLQDIPTAAGKPYTVSFWVAITSTSVGNFLGLNPVWDENTANQSTLEPGAFYYAPTNTGPVPYQFFSYNVTASTNLTRIDFHGIDQSGSILVDNIVVNPACGVTGDFDGDGFVTVADIPAFVSVLLGQATDFTSLCKADMNKDNKSDGGDVQEFVSAMVP